MIEAAVSLLLSAQNPDGGWGAVPGKRSNTEATSLALLALQSLNRNESALALRKAKTWLVERQNSDGSWPLADSSKKPSWSTAFAIIALSEADDLRDRVVKAGHWVLAQEGSKPGLLANLIVALFDQKKAVHLNEDLVGWPWTADSFSWVEPTSYFMLAVKKMKRYLPPKTVQERIQQAELMIYDRMCENGGWNYGNSTVYDDKLWPYPDVTAVALMALQDRRDRKENQLSLRALNHMLKDVDSGLALGWSSICFSLYGLDTTEYQKLLLHRFEKTKFLGETKPTALTILALGNGTNYFRV